MRLTVVVHLVDVERFPTIPAGMWRWAVMLGGDWSDVGACLNAGAERSEYEAKVAGESAAVVGVRVAWLHGNETADMDMVVLGHDPCPSDPITVGA